MYRPSSEDCRTCEDQGRKEGRGEVVGGEKGEDTYIEII